MTAIVPVRRTTTSPSRTTARSADAPDAEDRDLGVIHDRRLEEARELPGARDREGRAPELARIERPGTRTLREPADLGIDLLHRASVRAAHDGNDESLLRLNGDPDVVPVEVDDRVGLESRVQLGKLRERRRHRLHDGREEPVQLDVLEVALLDPRDRGDLRVRAAHVLGYHAADAAQRLAPSLSAAPPPAAARTSSSVMRPPGPVAETVARSTPSSAAIFRTNGVA